MQFTLFYTTNCLYISFVIFLISLQLSSIVNVLLPKILQLLCPRPNLGVCTWPPLRGSRPSNLTYHFQKRSTAFGSDIIDANFDCFGTVEVATDLMNWYCLNGLLLQSYLRLGQDPKPETLGITGGFYKWDTLPVT